MKRPRVHPRYRDPLKKGCRLAGKECEHIVTGPCFASPYRSGMTTGTNEKIAFQRSKRIGIVRGGPYIISSPYKSAGSSSSVWPLFEGGLVLALEVFRIVQDAI